MQVTETIVQIESNWFSAERDVKRTKGLHLSGVIDYIEFLQNKRAAYGEALSQAGNNYAAGGFAWERVLFNVIERSPMELFEWMFGRALAEPTNPLVIRPGEQCMDCGPCPKCNGVGFVNEPTGALIVKPDSPKCSACEDTGRVLVFMTPDGYHIDDMILEEWKYTTKSAKSDIRGPKFKRWLSYQIPSYLKSLDLTACRLRVYFARGDYADVVPMWKEFLLEYSQTEIDEIWDMIMRHAILMYREVL